MISVRQGGWWLCVGLAAVALTSFHLVWGDLNQDEGWYLYAARMVRSGYWPYRDFAFTQGPVWPLVYSFFDPVVERWGVAGGRVVTAIIGFGAVFLAARLAGRLSRDASAASLAVFTAACLSLLNPVQAYFMTVVKTYALCAFFLAAGLLLFPHPSEPRKEIRAFGALFLLTAAMAVRLSAAAGVGSALAVLFWKRREYGRAFWVGGLGMVLAILMFILPFYFLSPEGFRFGLFEYHAGRTVGGLRSLFLLKMGFASRVIQSFYVVILLGGAVGLRHWVTRGREGPAFGNPCGTVLGLTVAGMTLVHAMAPFPYDDYQAPVFPLAAAGVAAWAASLSSWGPFLRPMVLGATLLAAFASPLNQEWMVRGRDRIWWRLKDRPPLRVLQEVAKEIERLDPGGKILLTQDLYLAVESRRMVPRGMELGPFCLFPGFTEEKAEVRRVMTPTRMEVLFREGPAPVAAFSGYGLSIRAPEIVELSPREQESLWCALQSRYRRVGEIPSFGQAGTTLTIWTRLDDEGAFQPRRAGD